tara:strand:- start:309 stop:455 length:147 start_codon:yes stop_codon:yes gene_type:complete
MATKKTKELKTKYEMKRHMKTSIGRSTNTSPKNKNKKRDWKAYRGQGK